MIPTTKGPGMPDLTRKTATRTEFAANLIELDKGRVHDDATDRLAELIMAVEHTAKGGTLTLQIAVEPMDPKTFEDTGALLLTGKVTTKLPQLERAPSVFYTTGVDGQVTRTDPNRNDPRGDRDAA